MRESVSAVFTTSEKIYFIKRQNYLPVFPGYFATPGGKVDEADSNLSAGVVKYKDRFPKDFALNIIEALVREVREELEFDLIAAIESGLVVRIDNIGTAITPEFNPYRFKNYYINIELKHIIDFKIDENEIEFGEWSNPSDLLDRYNKAEVLAVPPAVTLLKAFSKNLHHSSPIDLSLPHDPETEVPMIESLCGVRQFLPLSNTFPPANRTNCFIIGDEGSEKYLIDPSPKDQNEYKKLVKSIKKYGFNKILLTHHHPDHYEYSLELAQEFGVGFVMSEYTYKKIGREYFADIQVSFLKEGDVLTKSLGIDVVVFDVPGHDEGQIALAPKSLNWFLAGDLIQTIGTVVIGAPEGDMKKYFHSLERVIQLSPKNLIPSHGIIVGGTHKMSETLNHRKEREVQIKELLKQNKNIDEMLAIVYEGLKPALLPYARKTIEAHLQKINQEK
jgi:ribonuclease/clavin/mitogillin